MASFVQCALALVSFVISLLGGAFVILWTISRWNPLALLIYGGLLAVALFGLCRPNVSKWLRRPALGFALASPVLAAMTSYGRLVLTVLVGVIALAAFTSVLRKGFGPCGRILPMAWMAGFAVPVFIFALDHACFAGRVFAFKWSQIENPFFGSPIEIGESERHGRKAIYVYDWNGPDPAAVALVWGWSVYPEFIDLGERRPEGSLLSIPAIQEVTQ